MFPKGPRLDIIYEADGGEIHISVFVSLDSILTSDCVRRWCLLERTLRRHLRLLGNRLRELSRSEYVWEKGVVVEAPNTVRTGWFEGIRCDKHADEFEISEKLSVSTVDHRQGVGPRTAE